jgi:hypothetical protein
VPQPGTYALTLRQLGSFLDAQRAQQVAIVDHDSFYAVEWEASGVRRESCFTPMSLPRPVTETLGVWAARLRALGRLLDHRGIEIAHITQADDGFEVSGTQHGKYFTARYGAAELPPGQSTPVPMPIHLPAAAPLQRRLQQLSRPLDLRAE